MPSISDISKALKFGKDTLLQSGIKDAELSAELLLAEILCMSRQSLYSHFDDCLRFEQQKLYESYIHRRALHEPLQYILGYAYFRGLKIHVESGVLIPRPETEQLVEATIKNLANNYNKILEIGTGSGCIACAFANEFSDLKIVATDISEKAITCANKNVSLYNFEEKIELVHCDMADEVYEYDFDLIISNPPYVPTQVYESLDSEVKDFEPKQALVAGDDGLLYLERIIDVAKDKLKSGGIVALELHEDNLGLAKQKFIAACFNKVSIYNDLANKPRILIAKLKS